MCALNIYYVVITNIVCKFYVIDKSNLQLLATCKTVLYNVLLNFHDK